MSRIDRVESLLKQEIAQIIRTRIGDERIGFISLLRIELSKDLRYGKVFYSQIGSDKDIERTVKGLKAAAPFVHSELCRLGLSLQTIPKLTFHYDSALKKGSETLEKLNQLE